MTKSPSPRPDLGRWLIFLALAFWLAIVPLVVTASLSVLNDSPPSLLVQLGLTEPGAPVLPDWALGLLATLLSLGLDLLLFVPLFFATRRPGGEFLHTIAILLISISLFQSLNALARLPWLGDTDLPSFTLGAALRLVLVLPFLLLGLAGLEARQQGCSLGDAWRRVGLRLWFNPSAMWLSLAASAIIVGPWVLVGSLGSIGTTAANLLQALPDALDEEILFRGIAIAWLWRAVRGRTGAVAGSLLLFTASQGGSVLPAGDWGELLRFAPALPLGLLVTELTIRAGGSIWPAVMTHFLYNWFPLAFVDPRSREEILHWVVQVWMPVAAGGVGIALWLGRKGGQWLSRRTASQPGRRGLFIALAVACLAWVGIAVLYINSGVPGFHPDGFLILLEEQADLGSTASIVEPVERRALVHQTLVELARRSQTPLWAELDRRGVSYRAHYLINVIEVQERPGLRHAFAKMPGVASVMFQPGMRRYPRTFELPDLDANGPGGVEWNVREVGADLVWELGFTGQGVLVGDADTGVDWEHPALKAAYLGWNDGAASHDYHWYDPWDGRPEPWDDSGHGTHTTGTLVGLDGENQVGLAPGARWIACRNMRHGIGNPGSYVSCMEFLLAPWPLNGDPLLDGAPSRGAHVVNNSWGCPSEEGCLPDTLRRAVENLRAAGQMMVVSAGNEGPACGTVQSPPALYDSVLSVGAITQSDRAASFSSRGPVTADGSQRPKPDIVAPGVDVRSSVPGGYASFPGTSMAGPHVAGAVALLWSAEPDLIGDIDRTESTLIETAQELTVDAVCGGGAAGQGTVCACGSDGPDSVPNQVYGWGQVDAWAAVQSLIDGR
ncbi:S8 family serine peptidase [Chloroflexota bacterium]